jgi:phosphate transport system substrate-binding protein
MATITCPQCGAVNPAGSKFCYNCGISLTQHLQASRPLGAGPTTGAGPVPSATKPGTPAAPGASKPAAPTPTPAPARPGATPPTVAPGNEIGNRQLVPGVSISQGRYVIDKALGKGGMGSIFLAHDTRLDDKPVVIKEMLHNFANDAERIEAEEAFKAERSTLAGLRHPNIPQITDFPTESGRFFIVQDYVDGEDLQKKLDALGGKPLPERQVLQWVSQVLSVLDYLEKQNPQVIHRDIKPANILVDSLGRVQVVDFGVASHRFRVGTPGAGTGKATSAMGTPGYAPREQFTGDETPLSDLYALGATMHQLLTGRNPQGVEPLFTYPPIRQLNPAVSEATVRIVEKALQNDPKQRWQSAAAMKAAVDALLQPKTLLSSTRGKLTAFAVLLVLLIAVGAGATIYGTQQGKNEARVPTVLNVGSSAAPVHLIGAGSTFAEPFLATTLSAYSKINPIAVTYNALGSGTGITDFEDNKVDFGVTDVPMNTVEQAVAESNGSGVLQLPILLGGIAISYNLSLPSGTQLQLNGPTLAAIFLGQITRWNDPAIANLNPGVKLPSQPITVVHRSDGSGTTYIFTNYLSTISNAWLLKTGGAAKSLAPWPAGIGASGNPGVAAAIKAHSGAIGYVELNYAIDNHLSYMKLQNQDNAFVSPSAATVLAAANQFPHVNANNFSIVNAPGTDSYPICGYSWGLVRAHHANTAHGSALIGLFHWLTTAGQSYSPALNYVPLPQIVQLQSAQTLEKVMVG